MPEEIETKQETLHNFSLNFKQVAKDKSWILESVKVRANTKKELNDKLNEAFIIALAKQQILNDAVKDY